MRSLALLLLLFCGSAHAAFPLSCWTNGAATTVTIAGYSGAAKRVSVSFPLAGVPLGSSVQNLSAPAVDVTISSISLTCRDEKPATGVRAIEHGQQMYLETSGKILAGQSLPVPIWVDEGPGFRRVTIGGKPPAP